MISQVKLEHMFVPFYLTVCLAGVVAAIVSTAPAAAFLEEGCLRRVRPVPQAEAHPHRTAC